jgi:hypothetical protein
VIKSNFLAWLLKARVAGWRWSLVGTAAVTILVGTAFTSLPKSYEWVELSVGEPAILATYLFVLWKWAFRPEDRALFKKLPGAGAAAPAT